MAKAASFVRPQDTKSRSGAQIGVTVSDLLRQRKGETATTRVWCKALVNSNNDTQALTVPVKRTERVPVSLTPEEKTWLDAWARRDRVSPAEKAWHILADVREGKLVPAPPVKAEVAA